MFWWKWIATTSGRSAWRRCFVLCFALLCCPLRTQCASKRAKWTVASFVVLCASEWVSEWDNRISGNLSVVQVKLAASQFVRVCVCGSGKRQSCPQASAWNSTRQWYTHKRALSRISTSRARAFITWKSRAAGAVNLLTVCVCLLRNDNLVVFWSLSLSSSS